MAHEFLSDDWIAAIEALRDEAPEPAAVVKDVVINIVVTDTPFGEREMRLEEGRLEQGLADGAPTTMTMPHDVAEQLFITQDQQAVTQAFMGGKIKVTTLSVPYDAYAHCTQERHRLDVDTSLIVVWQYDGDGNRALEVMTDAWEAQPVSGPSLQP